MSARPALILLNGEGGGAAALRRLARRAGLVICADGGARRAAAAGLVPDLVVGDLDSLPARLPPRWAEVRVVRDADEERSDLDKALDAAAARGASEVWVVGARGGGLDHELVNFAVLESRFPRLRPVVLGPGGEARLLGPGRHRMPLRRGRRFSLLAAPRAVLSVSGARWSLRSAALSRGSRGLGNRALGPVTVAVSSGKAWLVLP